MRGISVDKKQKLLDLVDKAGRGSIEAAEMIAAGYYNGDFGDKNYVKARKWASYAARHGSVLAAEIMVQLESI
jgi:TPR repeat protein